MQYDTPISLLKFQFNEKHVKKKSCPYLDHTQLSEKIWNLLINSLIFKTVMKMNE